MKKLVLLIVSIGIFVGCNKDCYSLLPKCLNEKIDKQELNPSGAITRYTTQKGFVYEVFLGDFADIFDEKCKVVCTLGGFAGNTICFDGTDTLTLSNPVVVWEE